MRLKKYGERAGDFCVCKCEDKKVVLPFFFFMQGELLRDLRKRKKKIWTGLKAITDGI